MEISTASCYLNRTKDKWDMIQSGRNYFSIIEFNILDSWIISVTRLKPREAKVNDSELSLYRMESNFKIDVRLYANMQV